MLVLICSLSIVSYKNVYAQNLESPNYEILNSTVDSGGGVSESSGYGLLSSAGVSGSDTRLESTNYRFRSGFPNPFQANVPLVKCFETNTDNLSSDCDFLPNANGMIGECGDPGCFNRAKLEIDHQNNPIDTLFLVALSLDSFTTTLYLQSDHSFATTFDINDYMTKCELEGRDDNDPNCNDSGDPNWNTGLQSYNIYGLKPNTTYQIMVRAVSGDFTETEFSPTDSATTELPMIALDLDTDINDVNTNAPYSIDLGQLSNSTVSTADKSIWVDISTNSIGGINVYVQNLNGSTNGLYSSLNSAGIPSESEDLDVDDGDGGYGLKIASVTQASLGPLQNSATFNTAGANQVGLLSTTPTTIFFTNTTGANRGPVADGRGRIRVKARSFSTLPAGVYTDTITFTALGNW